MGQWYYEGVGHKGPSVFTGDTMSASGGAGFNNWFTGNLDFAREVDLLQRQQSFNALEAQKQRDFEERLSGSAYQRAVSDLDKAGFNKGLLLGSASPSSTPSGAVASGPSVSAGKSGQGWSGLFRVLTSLVGLAVGAYNKGSNSSLKINQTNAMRDMYQAQADMYRAYANAYPANRFVKR